MSKHLVIVESPAKAKTIKKYLGNQFEVLASYGHVRDLRPKNGAVDPAHDFKMQWDSNEKSQKQVESICQAMQTADILYLATDPDREGEAISWHLYDILSEKGILASKPVYRVVFHEITQRAIQEAIEHPREISMELVEAYKARRALDYLVGFNLSPLLWKKIRKGLSAGRVQSPALRMIVEREQEIENFKPQEYWSIEADNEKEKQAFVSRLTVYAGEKQQQFSINNEAQATETRDTLLKLAQGFLTVLKVDRKQRKRQPSPPFITSTLQQEAARKLGFTTKKTMQIAQQLYEGIDIGNGAVGLISYMRTDSVNLAQEAVQEIRQTISERYGEHNLPKNAPEYKTRAKNAQEAHEAIRPTESKRLPEAISSFLTADQIKLYALIWRRTVACQMIPATLDTVAVDLQCGNEKNLFRANGSVVVDPGFMAVYQEDVDDKKGDDDEGRMLPPLEVGEQVKLKTIRAEQHFTEPPPRYSEASLVKALEEYGIGRPSTYATIISTLQQREYVILDKKRFRPTDVGRIVNKFLTEHFTNYVNYDFTARLEDDLDAVSRGEKQWVPLMHGFWTEFKTLVDIKTETVKRGEVTQEAVEGECPKCGKSLVKRLGKNGTFVGCTGYPECDYTCNLDTEGNQVPINPPKEAEVVQGRDCPLCHSPLHIKQTRAGSRFIGCSQYPKCKHTEAAPEDNTGVTCPQCRVGMIVKRKTRFGTFFYSCSNYPSCQYALSHPPLPKPCPQCGCEVTMLRTTKRWGVEQACPNKACGYHAPISTAETAETAE